MADSSLSDRLSKLEDREAIRELVGRFGFLVDDRDIEALAMCFTADGCFRTVDGTMAARGRDAVVEQFHARFAVLGPANHFTHAHLIDLDAEDRDRARGLVSSHAEVVRDGTTLLTAMRYHDVYRRESGVWRFEERELSYFYYLEPSDYASGLAELDRMRAYDEPRPADVPEGLESWKRYYAQHPRPS